MNVGWGVKLYSLVSCESWRDVTCHVVRTTSCLFQHGGRRRSCRARRYELVALVVTNVLRLPRLLRWSPRAMSRLLYSTCNTARTTFSCTNMLGLDRVSWRVATWRNKWNFWLYPTNVSRDRGSWIFCRLEHEILFSGQAASEHVRKYLLLIQPVWVLGMRTELTKMSCKLDYWLSFHITLRRRYLP